MTFCLKRHSSSSSLFKHPFTWPISINLLTFHFKYHNLWSILLAILTQNLTFSPWGIHQQLECHSICNKTITQSILLLSEISRQFRIQITWLYQINSISTSLLLGIHLLLSIEPQSLSVELQDILLLLYIETMQDSTHMKIASFFRDQPSPYEAEREKVVTCNNQPEAAIAF